MLGFSVERSNWGRKSYWIQREDKTDKAPVIDVMKAAQHDASGSGYRRFVASGRVYEGLGQGSAPRAAGHRQGARAASHGALRGEQSAVRARNACQAGALLHQGSRGEDQSCRLLLAFCHQKRERAQIDAFAEVVSACCAPRACRLVGSREKPGSGERAPKS